MQKAIGKLPDYVTFVPIDFNTQSLDSRLQEHGYSEKSKTIFIWQGR